MFARARTERVALLALLFVLNFPGISQNTPSRPEAITSSKTTEPVILTTTVVDKKGNFILGLKRNHFVVEVDKAAAEIIDVREEDLPLSVGIVFDASASVGFHQMDRSVKFSQRALGNFLRVSNQANEYFLMGFNIKPQLLLDWTNDSKAIVNTLGLVEPKGTTALYDACYLALDKVRNGRYAKRVLVLITDGQDNSSTYSRKQVEDELKRTGVIVYSLNLFNPDVTRSALGVDGQRVLQEFSLATGGLDFYNARKNYLDEKDVISAFQSIALELRHQYNIVIADTTATANNKWHKIKVTVEAPGEKHLTARTRAGFYSRQQ